METIITGLTIQKTKKITIIYIHSVQPIGSLLKSLKEFVQSILDRFDEFESVACIQIDRKQRIFIWKSKISCVKYLQTLLQSVFYPNSIQLRWWEKQYMPPDDKIYKQRRQSNRKSSGRLSYMKYVSYWTGYNLNSISKKKLVSLMNSWNNSLTDFFLGCRKLNLFF